MTVRDSKGRRTFNLLDREKRVHAYTWLSNTATSGRCSPTSTAHESGLPE